MFFFSGHSMFIHNIFISFINIAIHRPSDNLHIGYNGDSIFSFMLLTSFIIIVTLNFTEILILNKHTDSQITIL